MADEELRGFVLDALSEIGVRARPMFGGHGLYLGDKFFGIITNGTVYFRTDEESRGAYVARGMPALQPKHRPRGPKTVDRNFQVPVEVLEDGELLVAWALRAAEA